MSDNWLLIIVAGILVYLFTRSKGFSNSQVMSWTDYRGHNYRIEVTRDVHPR